MLTNQVHAVISQCKICAQMYIRTDMVLVLITLLLVFLPLFSVDLLHWRDVKQSGLVFGSVLLLLFSLNPVQRGECYSVSCSGCPLRHHQFPSLQISPARQCKKPTRATLQVSPTLSLCLSPLYVLSNESVHSLSWLLSFQGLSGGGDRSVCRSDQ